MGRERQIEINKDSIRLRDRHLIHSDSEIEFTAECLFDEDKYFGTDIANNEDSFLMGFWVVFDPDTCEISANYAVDDGKGHIESFDWELTDEEKEFIKELMDEYVRAEGLLSIDEWYMYEMADGTEEDEED